MDNYIDYYIITNYNNKCFTFKKKIIYKFYSYKRIIITNNIFIKTNNKLYIILMLSLIISLFIYTGFLISSFSFILFLLLFFSELYTILF